MCGNHRPCRLALLDLNRPFLARRMRPSLSLPRLSVELVLLPPSWVGFHACASIDQAPGVTPGARPKSYPNCSLPINNFQRLSSTHVRHCSRLIVVSANKHVCLSLATYAISFSLTATLIRRSSSIAPHSRFWRSTALPLTPMDSRRKSFAA